jgi:transposase-like protein
MPERRRRFSPQFKAEAVQMVLETGRSIAEVARDLGIHDGTLGNWLNGWRREHPEPDQPLTALRRFYICQAAFGVPAVVVMVAVRVR